MDVLRPVFRTLGPENPIDKSQNLAFLAFCENGVSRWLLKFRRTQLKLLARRSSAGRSNELLLARRGLSARLPVGSLLDAIASPKIRKRIFSHASLPLTSNRGLAVLSKYDPTLQESDLVHCGVVPGRIKGGLG